jgi:hypothetical protein
MLNLTETERGEKNLNWYKDHVNLNAFIEYIFSNEILLEFLLMT